jgi:hypothetical protein
MLETLPAFLTGGAMATARDKLWGIISRQGQRNSNNALRTFDEGRQANNYFLPMSQASSIIMEANSISGYRPFDSLLAEALAKVWRSQLFCE